MCNDALRSGCIRVSRILVLEILGWTIAVGQLTATTQLDRSMTAQFSESLLLDGEAVGMFTNPLDTYFSLGGKQPAFDWRYSTAL